MHKRSLMAQWLVAYVMLLAQLAEARPLQLEDYLDLEQVSQPQISPDGRTIIYSRSRVDSFEDRRDSEWWVMDVDGDSKRKLMSSGSNVRWSADGSRIAYIDQGQHGAAIFVRWMDARGATNQVTHRGPIPERLFWSPDGRWIAFKATVPAPRTWDITLPRKPAGAKWTDDATVVDKLHYRIDKSGHSAGYVHLFVVPAEGGPARQLTHGEWHAEPRKAGLHSWSGGDIEWTRDSRSIVFGADLRADDAFARASLNIVDIADGRIRTIAGKQGFWGEAASPRVSPDGKRVAYVGEQEAGSSNFSPFEIRVADLDGGNERVVLRNISSSVDYLQWAADGRSLYYVIAKEGSRSLYSVSLSGKISPVSVAEGTQSLSMTSSGNGIAVGTLTNAYRTADIVSVSLKNGQRRALASANAELFGGIQLGRVEEIWYDSADRTRVQGWIVYPPDFDARRKYPLILKIHGGPAIMMDGSFAFDAQAFAAQGYVVFYPNYRGSPGYGMAFAQAIHNSFPGGPAYVDLISGVDAVVARGFIDESRMYVMGHSAGGALTAWVITQTQRFAAAAALAPYVNLISLTGTADIPTWADTVFARPFWEQPERWLANSSIMRIGKVSTPTLVMVGEHDLRTPVAQSEELFTGLKRVGVPARLVLIKDEPHGLTTRPSNMLRTQLYVLKWFGEWPRRDRS